MTSLSSPVDEWSEQTLNLLVSSDVHESLRLDYKASAALARTEACKKELSKDISAFANSDGGQIVYGIVEKNHHPSHVDEGVSAEANITREWIEQVITSTIRPRIPGLKIKPIVLTSGGTAYVIEIPQSSVGPHQASDRRYYKRHNFLALPMEDYEVRDILRRATTPSPYLTVNLVRETSLDGIREATIRVSAGNKSAEPAVHYVIKLYLPIAIVRKPVPGFEKNPDMVFAVGEAREPCSIYIKKHSAVSHLPLYREELFQVTDFDISPIPKTAGYDFGFEVTCPGFKEYRQGVIFCTADNTTVQS